MLFLLQCEGFHLSPFTLSRCKDLIFSSELWSWSKYLLKCQLLITALPILPVWFVLLMFESYNPGFMTMVWSLNWSQLPTQEKQKMYHDKLFSAVTLWQLMSKCTCDVIIYSVRSTKNLSLSTVIKQMMLCIHSFALSRDQNRMFWQYHY